MTTKGSLHDRRQLCHRRDLARGTRRAAVRRGPGSCTEQASIARDAYRDFGKGSGHPAQLNFGDCFAYALAAETGEPLLFKGNDFSQTDLRSALAAGEDG